jgi:hypothetical protein
MKLHIACALLVFASPAFSQEGGLAAEFDKEKRAFKADCLPPDKAAAADPNRQAGFVPRLFACGADILTATPLHLGAGTIAPGNGVALGPVFGFEHHYKPQNFKDPQTGAQVSRGRALRIVSDGAASPNGSWRAGGYLQLLPYEIRGPVALEGPPPEPSRKDAIALTAIQPDLTLYGQSVSLNELGYYGEGQFTSRSDLALFGLTETIAGATAKYPVFRGSGLSLFGEVNGRWLDPRPRQGRSSPSIEQLYTEATAPGLLRSLAYFQAGEGIRWQRWIGIDKLNLNYSATYQQFVSTSDSQYSFQRFNLDAQHEIPIIWRSTTTLKSGRKEATYNRWGSVELRALVTMSFVPDGHSVPYYLQPTIGGSNINGEPLLPSYPDYRFRAPNMMVFRAAVEHALWKKAPIGGVFMADYGRVAMNPDDLGFEHFRHSWAVGLSVRAGGQTALRFLFAFGGGEGTHTTALMNSVLMNGVSRPSLF